MLRSILSLMALVCLVGVLHGQRTELYVIGGLSSAIVKQNGETNNFARHYSWHTGLLFDVGADHMMFETGLLYSTRGTKITAPIGNLGMYLGTDYSTLKITYLDIPALFVIAPTNFRLFVGPQLSIMTRVMYEGEVLTSDQVSNTFNRTSLGIRYGFGFHTESNLVLQVSFITGISDIYKHPDYKWRNNAWQFGIGYKLHSDGSGSRVGSGSKKKDDGIIPSHRMLD